MMKPFPGLCISLRWCHNGRDRIIEFPAQMASNVENVSIWWRHHDALLGEEGLTHWGWVTHICVSRLTIIGSDNGLSPSRHQIIIWTNVGILLIWPLGTNFSEISIKIQIYSFKKMHLIMSSAKGRDESIYFETLKYKWWWHHSRICNDDTNNHLWCILSWFI